MFWPIDEEHELNNVFDYVYKYDQKQSKYI